MSKPRIYAKRERTRALIYENALKLFQRDGFEATTMRRIASASDLSTGAAYYHFASKDEIVLEFYLRSETRLQAELGKICAASPDFFERLRSVLEFRLQQFHSHRKFIGVLFQNAVTPDNRLSPFHSNMHTVREEAVAVFAHLLNLARLKIPQELEWHCADLLWLYQLGILLYWLHDSSAGQKRTRRLMRLSLAVIRQLLRLQRLPFAQQLTRSVLDLLSDFSFQKTKAPGARPRRNRNTTPRGAAPGGRIGF